MLLFIWESRVHITFSLLIFFSNKPIRFWRNLDKQRMCTTSDAWYCILIAWHHTSFTSGERVYEVVIILFLSKFSVSTQIIYNLFGNWLFNIIATRTQIRSKEAMGRVESNSIFHFELEISCVLLETIHEPFGQTTLSNSPEGSTPKLQSSYHVIQSSKPGTSFTRLWIPVENADH